jgi:hypothetical protein
VHQLVNEFGETKKALVAEIGFKGLLHFPSVSQIDRRFAVWIMCRVDHMTQTVKDCHSARMMWPRYSEFLVKAKR